jgi:hypothetical protein
MSTKKNNKVTDEGINEAARTAPADLGALPVELAAKLEVVDVLDSMPTFVPAKPGFEIGKTLAGYYVGTKKVVSDKFTAGKVDDQGNKYRLLHMFKDTKGRNFGIWSVGQLAFVMTRVNLNQLVAITYEGRAAESIKPGQAAPHEFTIQAEGELRNPDAGHEYERELEAAGAIG